MQFIAAGSDLFLLTERHPVLNKGFVGLAGTELLLHAFAGGNWSNAELVAVGAPELREGRFARDGVGNLHFIWLATRNASGPPDPNDPTHDAFVRYRTRSASGWSAAQTLYERTQHQGVEPRGTNLAAGTDGDGRVHMTFAESGPGSAWMYIQDGSSLRTELFGGSSFSYPSFSTGGIGGLSLTYRIGNAVWAARFRDGNWAPGVLVHDPPFGRSPHSLRIVVERSGRHHLAWPYAGSNDFAVVHATSPDGTQWSGPITVAIKIANLVSLAVDTLDRLHLIWESDAEAGYHRRQNGTWSGSHGLPQPRMSHIQLAFDGDSRLHAVWRDSDGGLLYHASLDVTR